MVRIVVDVAGSAEERNTLFFGCDCALEELGGLKELVKVIEISFPPLKNGKEPFVPRVEIVFKDPFTDGEIVAEAIFLNFSNETNYTDIVRTLILATRTAFNKRFSNIDDTVAGADVENIRRKLPEELKEGETIFNKAVIGT